MIQGRAIRLEVCRGTYLRINAIHPSSGDYSPGRCPRAQWRPLTPIASVRHIVVGAASCQVPPSQDLCSLGTPPMRANGGSSLVARIYDIVPIVAGCLVNRFFSRRISVSYRVIPGISIKVRGIAIEPAWIWLEEAAEVGGVKA